MARSQPDLTPNDADPLAQLIRNAGRRPPIPPGREQRVHAAVKAEWRRVVRQRRKRLALIFVPSGLVAAAFLFAVIAHFVRSSLNTPVPVAAVEFLDGTLNEQTAGAAHSLNMGGTANAGATIETDASSRAALRLADGQSLRLDRSTRLHIDAGTIHLEKGAVYIDTAQQTPGKLKQPVHIQAEFADIFDVGTQFEVRLSDADRPLTVRVRDGKVELKRGSDKASIAAGEELSAAATGQFVARTISAADSGWDWALACVPAVHSDGIAANVKDLPGVVSFVKVLSDKVEDVSSLEAWKKSFIKDGMSDEQKALAVWTSVVKFRHQSPPPNEYLGDANVHDAIKTFNVYGYGMCCCASSNMEELARCAGLQAQGRGINGHSVPEVFWNGGWHLLDASLINYFPKADKSLASVDEIVASIADWKAHNPQLKGKDMMAYMRFGGWKKGPPVLAHCPFYSENGWLPAATHGWYSTLSEYDGSNKFIYEYGYSQGYQVNVQLREGERLTRNWSNKGLQVNDVNDAPIGEKVGQGDMTYSVAYGDLAPGRIGNGTLEYNVPLASGAFAQSALLVENLASRTETHAGAAVQVKDATKPGVLILRMPSSYVYLTGVLSYDARIGPGGDVSVSFSDNNGISWTEISKAAASGPQTVDLKAKVLRHYDYRLKFELKGSGTGLDTIRIVHDIQHSQRALPALAQGKNTISFSTGPAEGTVTIEPALNYGYRGKNVFITDFTKDIAGFNAGDFFIHGAKAHITIPIATPGDLTRIRLGTHFRARDVGDAWDYQVSFDNGKTYRTIGRAAGPTPGFCKYATFTDVPPGARSALVRFAGTQTNTCGLFSLTINADYKEPSGGFRPVKVTYVWDENGVEKKDTHIATGPAETYTIDCASKPVMKALVVELAQ